MSSIMSISLAVDRLMHLLVLDISNIPTVVISHVVSYHLTPAIRKVHIVVTLEKNLVSWLYKIHITFERTLFHLAITYFYISKCRSYQYISRWFLSIYVPISIFFGYIKVKPRDFYLPRRNPDISAYVVLSHFDLIRL